jgi:hypothetical protein
MGESGAHGRSRELAISGRHGLSMDVEITLAVRSWWDWLGRCGRGAA